VASLQNPLLADIKQVVASSLQSAVEGGFGLEVPHMPL